MARAILRKQNPVTARFTEIGRCYKGSPKGTSKRGYAGGDDYASSYIRFEPAERLKLHPATTDAFESLYEEFKARWEVLIKEGRVRIRFPHYGIDENFVWSNKVIKAIGGTEKTFRECDGTTCTKWVESAQHPTKKGQTIPKFVRGEKACSAIEGKECPEGCQAKGMLKFMVPDLYPGGIILFPLNSPVDISAIAGYLEPFKNTDLSAIPFSLFRKPDPLSWEEKGEMKSKAENWGLHLEIDPQISMLMMESRQRRFIGELQGDVSIAALTPEKPKSLAPASEELPAFGKSEDGYNFTIKVQTAIRNGSVDELNSAIEDALELVHANLYDFKSGIAFVEREQNRAMEALRDRTMPTVEVVPNDPFLTREEGLELWKLAASAKFTESTAKQCLNDLKIESFAKIPRDRASEVRKALSDTALALQYSTVE